MGATLIGAVPVTINWQADTLDRVAFKGISHTHTQLGLTHTHTHMTILSTILLLLLLNLLRSIPVTATQSKLIIVGPWREGNTVFSYLEMGLQALRERLAGEKVEIFHTSELTNGKSNWNPISDDEVLESRSFNDESERIVIFTSGTTGNPKGVRLTYKNYATNRSTFETFLGVSGTLTVVTVNPMHHTNSTALTDW